MTPTPVPRSRARHSLRPTFRALTLAATAALVATTLATAPAASADDDSFAMAGTAAATNADILAGTVTSGPTSSSELQTFETGQESTNRTADLEVKNILRVKALSTEVRTTAITDGRRVDSTSQAAGVDVLNGLVKLDAVTTTSTVTQQGAHASFSGDSELVGLTINKKKILPVQLKPNTTIAVPGLIEVVINRSVGKNNSDNSAEVETEGLRITLLKGMAGLKAGAIISVTPTTAKVQSQKAEGPGLAGAGFAVRARANVGDTVKLLVGPIAGQYLPLGGTDGQEIERSTVGLNVPFAARAQVLGTSVSGTRSADDGASGTVTAKAAKLNLFGGRIIVEAVTSSATVSRADHGADAVLSGESDILGLKLGGKKIPITTAPNTRINVANVGIVTLNQQVTTDNAILVTAIDIEILGKNLGLPVGAHVEIAGTYAAVSR